jgi:hypothetical protein
MTEISSLPQFLNVLILPALFFVVRIDRRLGQIDVITQDQGKRIETLESRVRNLELRKAPS